jgi:hypothetical protein
MVNSNFPDYSNAFTGVDLKTGKRINLFKEAFGKDAPDFRGSLVPANQTYPTTDTTGNILDIAKSIQQFEEARYPFELKKYQEMADIASRQQLQQISQLYPYLSAAGAEATARSLAASQAYRAFAEQLPSNVQNIMASKQAQATSAAGAEAERQRATAAQQDAASRYPGRFAGQYIQVG